jgi:apolipoprotein D and lipocalin family protein
MPGPSPSSRWRAGVALLALALASALCGPAAAKTPLAPSVDMSRMYGGWYIVATIPNPFERGMVAPYDVYSPAPDGGIKEDFYMRRGSFAATRQHYVVHDWIKPGTNNAAWTTQIIWPLRLPFLVLYVDPQYRYVIFGEDIHSIGWIYARDPHFSDADYAEALTHFQAAGYDPTKLRRVVQTPDQIGQPGFWSDGIH